jgi:nucleoid-associated protein YgaU
MRKDVKFGLTIGAILVITLVIYVIVLSRGGSSPQRISLATTNPSDQTAMDSPDAADSGTDPNLATHTDDYKPDAVTDAEPDATTGNIPATPPAQAIAPATQPAQANSMDWQGALDHGLPPSLSAPERTVTPTIDSPSSDMATSGITRSASTPMIDLLPTTQPTRPLMADVPTLDAPAEQAPAPTMSYNLPSSSIPTSNEPQTPAATQQRTHRVMAGESPYSISQEVYGNGKYYKKIMAANPGVDPHRLKIGQLLVIPELSDVDKPSSGGVTENAAPVRVDSMSAYRVVSGDSLESISRKLYGSANMIEKIYQSNIKLIGPNENMLKVGWILKLPQPPTEAGSQR